MKEFHIFFTAVVFVLLVATILPASAQTIRWVTTTGNASADGSSWANAMTLSAALRASTTAGDQVWIAGGTYKPHATDRTTTFRIPAGVTVYGGFAGTETAFDPAASDTRVRNADGAFTNETLLSGDLLGDDIARPVAGKDITAYHASRTAYHALRTDNSNTVVILAGANVTLNGLTITGGELGTEIQHPYESSGVVRVGAGLYAGSTATNAIVTACTFRDNGTIAASAGYTYQGGGAYFVANATVSHCTFTGNEAWYTGGGANFASAVTLSNCTFSGNEVEQDAGGAYFEGLATLKNCVFSANMTVGYGGGAYFVGSSTLLNCIFNNNKCKVSGGGAFFLSRNGGHATLMNCVFTGNSAGGATLNDAATLINCTFYNNSSEIVKGQALSMIYGTSLTLKNSILISNKTADQSELDMFGARGPVSTSIDHNLIDGGTASVTGSMSARPTHTIDLSTGQTAADVFASTTAGETHFLHLKAGSPGIDAGSNDPVNTASPALKTDAVGAVRIANARVDLGAYEYGSVLGIEEETNGFVLYPNPTSGKLHFSEQVGQFRLYSVEGRLLETRKNVRSADLTALSAGLYFVEVVRDGRSLRWRVVRE